MGGGGVVPPSRTFAVIGVFEPIPKLQTYLIKEKEITNLYLYEVCLQTEFVSPTIRHTLSNSILDVKNLIFPFHCSEFLFRNSEWPNSVAPPEQIYGIHSSIES